MAITSKDIRAVNLAKKLMGKSRHPKYRFCALIMKGKHYIGIGFNKEAKPKHFIEKLNPGHKHHAEIDALLWLDKESTKNCTLVVWGQTNIGNDIISRPCKSCLNFLIKHSIKRIVYSYKGEIREEKI